MNVLLEYLLTFAKGAITSNAVMCNLNFFVFVNFPIQVPRLIKLSLATLVANFIIASLHLTNCSIDYYAL